MRSDAIDTLQLTHRFGSVRAVDRLDLQVPLVSVAPVANGRPEESHLIALGLGIAGGVLVGLFGCWEMTRRDVM